MVRARRLLEPGYTSLLKASRQEDTEQDEQGTLAGDNMALETSGTGTTAAVCLRHGSPPQNHAAALFTGRHAAGSDGTHC